jgi:porin
MEEVTVAHEFRMHVRLARGLLVAVALLLSAGAASAQPQDIPATWGGTLLDRSRLTGDWFGLRDEMGKKGIVLDLDFLGTPQGVLTGGNDTEAQFWGNAEYTLNVDTQKLGLWPGGFFNGQAISGFGDTVTRAAGAIIPVNFANLLPVPNQNQTALMNLTFTQFLSKNFGLYAGKIYTFTGGDVNDFAHDYHSTFLNTALLLNMTLAFVPFSGYGGGLMILPWDGSVVSVVAIDPSGSPTNNDISEAFRDGVLLNGQARFTIKPFGLVGHQLVGFIWSDKERVSLQQDPANIARALVLNIPLQSPNVVNSTWSIYYNFDQYLWSPEGHPDQGIGTFFRFGASDGVANPIKYAFSAGISGKGIVPGRPRDTFGLGWARTQFSNNFVPILRERLHIGLDKEDAFEMYYNATITPWLQMSLDLQIINPALKKTLNSSGTALKNVDTSVVGGVRMYIRF